MIVATAWLRVARQGEFEGDSMGQSATRLFGASMICLQSDEPLSRVY
jgi:hypothetical protein